jgi:alpha-tubulin suppressor-like RCC1 family protein
VNAAPEKKPDTYVNIDGTTVSAGGCSSFIIKPDGSLWAWGENDPFQLGAGIERIQFAPVKLMDNL